jgi:hypothetical protein
VSERPFRLQVTVSDDAMSREDIGVRELVRDALLAKAADLRGPRGGRYVAVGEPYDFREGETAEDFIHGTRTFTARVLARYVRPTRPMREVGR